MMNLDKQSIEIQLACPEAFGPGLSRESFSLVIPGHSGHHGGFANL
jgi:hypothetical protein